MNLYKFCRYLGLVGLIFLSSGCANTNPETLSIEATQSSSSTPTLISASTPTHTPTPIPASTTLVVPPSGTEIVFDQSGDKPFTGTLYGEGETAIILANMSIGGSAQWDPFVASVDKEKFTTVTFDYRNINDPSEDIRLILDKLKEEGFERVVCIGASMGTRVCTTIAREPEIVGMALIAGAVHHTSVAETSYPKLFVSGALDVWAFDIQAGYEKAAEPKTLVLFENNRAHGTDLFRSDDSNEFLSVLIDFVNELANP